MERRRFLKLVGLAAIAAVPTTVGLATALAPAAYATLGGMAYRAEGGRVFVSRDGGRHGPNTPTWAPTSASPACRSWAEPFAWRCGTPGARSGSRWRRTVGTG